MSSKALLVIHDPAMVAAVSKSLARPDLTMTFSTTVGDALATLSRNQIAIVYCEARLPDGSFREVIRYLQAAGRETPVVVCGNFYDRGTEAESATLGANAYLTFPFPQKEVQRLADKALKRPGLESKTSRTKVAA